MICALSDGVVLSLQGKTALVTGGSRGVGAETVRLFHQAGARVVFNYRVSRPQAELLVEECGGPDHCRAIEQELNSVEEGRELVGRAVAQFGRLDILVVNHGIWPPEDAPISSMRPQQWRQTMGVNLDSVFGLVSAAAAQMSAAAAKSKDQRLSQQPAGHIVLVSSTAGQRGEAFHADYAVTKGALISLTKSLSSELAPDGIYVNCVAPGWIDTEMSASALADPEKRRSIFSSIPLGRVATPKEVAGPILFLCTPLAGFISGEIFNVNGGASWSDEDSSATKHSTNLVGKAAPRCRRALRHSLAQQQCPRSKRRRRRCRQSQRTESARHPRSYGRGARWQRLADVER